MFRVFVALLLSFTQFTLAAPPQKLDYQGYLAHSSGVPLTGSVNLEISLYDVDTGGTALWTQIGAVTLINGRFATVLDGSGVNPFPAALFDQQLYVGLTVESDPEMVPRQPLTSIPSAFEAHNSDTVDGMQANEIIDAASDEVRIPISNLPFTINQPGSYYFTQNLTAPSQALDEITISSGHVIVDLMGFTLGVAGGGFNISGRNVVIQNGQLNGGGFDGDAKILGGEKVHLRNLIVVGEIVLGDNSTVHKVQVSAANGNQPGIFVGRGSVVSNSTVSDLDEGASYCIRAAEESHILNNNLECGVGSGIIASRNTMIVGNTISTGDSCIRITGNETFVSNNLLECAAEGIMAADGANIKNNQVTAVAGGIVVGNHSDVTENVVNASLSHLDSAAIKTGISSNVKNNKITSADLNGIVVDGGSSVIQNTINQVGYWGIVADNGNGSIVTDNIVVGGTGGIRIGWDSLVENNKLDDNNDFGILVVGRGNVLRQNHVTDITGSGYCYRFEAPGNNEDDNAIIENTANGCTQAFSYINDNTIPASRNVGNIAW